MPSGDGERIKFVVEPVSRSLGDGLRIAQLLTESGLTLRAAKRVLDDLALGSACFVDAPHVTDFETLRRLLTAQKLSVRRIADRPVDVRALRARLGYSQEEFAGRFGIDVATLRNWEQGRTQPDGPARTLLRLIDRDPDAVTAMLAA